MKKKNFLLIIIILVAALLIGLVNWIYAKRIENIESKMKTSTVGCKTGELFFDNLMPIYLCLRVSRVR